MKRIEKCKRRIIARTYRETVLVENTKGLCPPVRQPIHVRRHGLRRRPLRIGSYFNKQSFSVLGNSHPTGASRWYQGGRSSSAKRRNCSLCSIRRAVPSLQQMNEEGIESYPWNDWFRSLFHHCGTVQWWNSKWNQPCRSNSLTSGMERDEANVLPSDDGWCCGMMRQWTCSVYLYRMKDVTCQLVE